MEHATTERAEWLSARRDGIGGSEAAVIMGVSPWKSAYSLWCEKTGLEPAEAEEPEWMEWGRRLEPVIADKYAEVTGRKVETRGDRNGIITHPRLPFMFGTTDRFAIDRERGDGVLEIKTLGLFKAEEWAEEPPAHYQVQLQHYFAVSGAQWGSFAALIGGQRFVWCDVERDDRFIAALEEECALFWERVQRGDPPPIDGSASTSKTLRALYPRDSGATVELPVEARDWSETIERCKAQIAALDEEKREAENRLKAAIGGAAIAVVPGGPTWTYRTQTREASVTKGSTFRVLRRKG